MATYSELLEQRQALEKEIEKARKSEQANVIAKVRAIVETYALEPADVFGQRSKSAGKSTGKVPPKYRDPVSGATWTGRGKPPAWIAGAADRAPFAI